MAEINYYEVKAAFYMAQDMPSGSHHTYFGGHIFDEDKSVKWNREEVERQNAIIRQQNKEEREARYNARIEAEKLIIDYLHQEWSSISKVKIAKLFRYIYDMHFEDNYQIERVIDICEEILEIFTQEDKE
jgi:hypothetical protein